MAMAIDEVVDDYTDESRVDVKDNVVRNPTLDCMELNYTYGGTKIYENLSLYTESDPVGDRIQFLSDYNISCNFIRNVDTRLYEDYGSGFFDVFEWESEMYFVNADSLGKIWLMLSNYTTNAYTQVTNNRRYLSFIMTKVAGVLQIDVIEGKSDGTQNKQSSIALNLGTWYYNKFKLNSTYWELSIFSNPLRTTLVDTVSISLAESKGVYRYLLISSLNSGHAIGITGYIRNIWLGNVTGGYDPDGYFKTTNFLAGLSYNATVLLTNTTIPSGSINAQISNDGVAWSDLGVLDVGYGAIDLRALGFINSTLMFNYTRGDPSETPRLFEVRLVHEGPGNGTTTTTSVDTTPFLAIGIILAMAMVLIADRLRK